ncbi:hypothetical protein AcW2_005586 [Taiwanofungus camphoratus]|nr:hypothetical protein AcW2_005586 [Antrodia cinnamomea]
MGSQGARRVAASRPLHPARRGGRRTPSAEARNDALLLQGRREIQLESPSSNAPPDAQHAVRENVVTSVLDRASEACPGMGGAAYTLSRLMASTGAG